MLKFIAPLFLSFLLTNVSQATNLTKLNDEYNRMLAQLADAQTPLPQRRKAEKAIERLAIKGEINAFRMLCAFDPFEDKALFARDFLARPLSKLALKNVGSFIASETKKSPNFLRHLRCLIAKIDKNQQIKIRLKHALATINSAKTY